MRNVTSGAEKTYSESIASGGSVTRDMVDTNLANGEEANTFFYPTTDEQKYTPLGLLSGRYTREEIEEARKIGAVRSEFIGRVLTGGEYTLYMSYEPLNEEGMTEHDPVLGRAEKIREGEEERIHVVPDERNFHQTLIELYESCPQPLHFREDRKKIPPEGNITPEGYTPQSFRK